MSRIAEINDRFRRTILTNPDINNKGGRCFVSRGVNALPIDLQMIITVKVRAFDTFTKDNDPYGEHDFGAFEIAGAGKIYWKIAYYEDETMQWGAEDPTTKAYRVLTIMLADEY